MPTPAKCANNPVDINIGARIKSRRLEIGMAQESLASSVGITFQQVQKYEKAENRVSASRLHAIARALSVPITYFYEGV